jgi:predicted phage replisome organizer/uncharacterized phage protein (TIGR02220 family)
MSDNKKYYYLRLKDNFFDSDELKILESMKDGYLYSNILLKLYLRSLKNDGKLVVNDRIPYNIEMLASVTGHQIGTVKQALSIFKDLGLIDVLENGAIYMLDIQNFIGRGSSEADRKRAYRQRIETDRTNVRQISDKNPPEIEIEIEIEKELEIDNKNCRLSDKSSTVVSEIIDYLNQKTGKHFRKSIANTARNINARIKEGFTVDDFKAVIDKKVIEWGKDERMKQYLRPQTLFGTKFESYLNQDLVENKSQTDKAIDVAKNVIEYYQEREGQDGKDGYGESFSTVTDRF